MMFPPLQKKEFPTETADAVPMPIPVAVHNSIVAAYPAEAYDILRSLHWDNLGGHFYFQRWGMYVGVETDGYIHT